MRDGIYKDLAVPRCWKSVLKCCERPSERGTMLQRARDKALRRDIRREVTPAFLKRVLKMACDGSPSLPGMGQFEVYASSRELGGKNLTVENSLLRHLCCRARSGECGSGLVTNALTDALVDRCEGMVRHAQGHYLSSADDAARPAMTALERSFNEAAIRRVAAEFVSGKPVVRSRIRSVIDVDLDDLSIVQ